MKRQFVTNPSSQYLEAVAALRQLLAAGGQEIVQCAYAEALWEAKLATFRTDVTGPGDAHVCLHRLKGEPCPERCDSPQVIPGVNHSSEWVKDGQTEKIVFQPYRLDGQTLKALLAFCEVHGLTVEISSEEAWHFPGASLFVQLRAANPKPVSPSKMQISELFKRLTHGFSLS